MKKNRTIWDAVSSSFYDKEKMELTLSFEQCTHNMRSQLLHWLLLLDFDRGNAPKKRENFWNRVNYSEYNAVEKIFRVTFRLIEEGENGWIMYMFMITEFNTPEIENEINNQELDRGQIQLSSHKKTGLKKLFNMPNPWGDKAPRHAGRYTKKDKKLIKDFLKDLDDPLSLVLALEKSPANVYEACKKMRRLGSIWYERSRRK